MTSIRCSRLQFWPPGRRVPMRRPSFSSRMALWSDPPLSYRLFPPPPPPSSRKRRVIHNAMLLHVTSVDTCHRSCVLPRRLQVVKELFPPVLLDRIQAAWRRYPPGPQISTLGWEFCMSGCAEFVFRVTQGAGAGSRNLVYIGAKAPPHVGDSKWREEAD